MDPWNFILCPEVQNNLNTIKRMISMVVFVQGKIPKKKRHKKNKNFFDILSFDFKPQWNLNSVLGYLKCWNLTTLPQYPQTPTVCINLVNYQYLPYFLIYKIIFLRNLQNCLFVVLTQNIKKRINNFINLNTVLLKRIHIKLSIWFTWI